MWRPKQFKEIYCKWKKKKNARNTKPNRNANILL